MTDHPVNATIELLGKTYPIRCAAAEQPALEQAAKWLNDQMIAIQTSGKAINVERIAMITALNIAHQFLQLEKKQQYTISQMNQYLAHLQSLLNHTLSHAAEHT